MNKKKIFYGWWVLAGCFFLGFYIGGIMIYGFTAYFEPIANEFGWSYTQISLASSLRGLEMSILAPLLGFCVDKWGPRRLLLGGVIITGIGLILLSRVSSLGMFYGAFVIIAIGLSPHGSTVMLTAVGNWFRKRIALVSGITASGFALGGLLVPVITTCINVYGWREVIFTLGLIMWIIGVPLSLLVRHKPEQYGYLPDGVVSNTVTTDDAQVRIENDEVKLSFKQIIRNSIFWRIIISYMFQFMFVNAVVTHCMPFLSSIGVDRATSSMVAGALPIMSIAGRLGFGWIGDRYNRKRIAVAGFTFSTLGVLLFYYASVGTWLLPIFLIVFGIGFGGNITLRPTLLREYFGRENFGTFFGFATGITMVGNMIGAPLTGWVYDMWQSYTYAWLGFIVMGVIAIAMLLSLPSADKMKRDLLKT